jgi:transposase-like protein
MKKSIQFDMDAAVKALREDKDLSGQDGILTPLIKQLTEAAMSAELDDHLSAEEQANRKNGSTPKTVKRNGPQKLYSGISESSRYAASLAAPW